MRNLQMKSLRWREYGRELAIAATHIPAWLFRRRITDGHESSLSQSEIDLAMADAREQFADAVDWMPGDVIPTVSDVAIIRLSQPQQSSVGFLKLARSASAEEGLRLQSTTINALKSDDRLGAWRRLLPEEVACRHEAGRSYVLERALPGVVMNTFGHSTLWKVAVANAIRAIGPLHDTSGSLRLVDDDLLASWTDGIFKSIKDAPTSRPAARYVASALKVLRRDLSGRLVWVSRSHGDFSPNNVMIDKSTGDVTGILDWDRSQLNQPAFVDIGQFVIGADIIATGRTLGTIVQAMCRENSYVGDDGGALESFWKAYKGDPVSPAAVGVMTLLNHVESNISKAPRYASHRLWWYRTLEVGLAGC